MASFQSWTDDKTQPLAECFENLGILGPGDCRTLGVFRNPLRIEILRSGRSANPLREHPPYHKFLDGLESEEAADAIEAPADERGTLPSD